MAGRHAWWDGPDYDDVMERVCADLPSPSPEV
jgi:hypothetical protein